MSTHSSLKPNRRAFTLIEMIGVLALIAILASLLLPKIYEAINSSRISNTALSYNSVKTALADHFAKFGSLTSSNGASITAGQGVATNFDNVLITEGFLDKPFQVKIGSGSYIAVVPAASAATAVDGTDAAYDLDGNDPTANDAPGSAVVEAIIPNVAGADAQALSTVIDGVSLSAADPTSADLRGRVKYGAVVGGVTTVYIYITHR